MVPNTDSTAVLVRACFEFPCTQQGNTPPRRSVDTCAAGEALRPSTGVGKVISPS